MRDFASFRALFPALERLVYLNTATVAPAARPVLDALQSVEREWESGDFSWQAWEREAHRTRALFARLIGATEDEVALRSSLAECAATVARSLPPGSVVVGAREFRSNLFPWLALRASGREVVEVRPVDGVTRTEPLVRATDERTALVAVTETQSSNGFRVRIDELAARCREVGARLFVNLTQSLGVTRFDVSRTRADFVAAVAYKWLLGPRGTGWLYVRADRLAEVEALAPSWKSVADPYAGYYGAGELAPDARRLDASLAWFPWLGTKAALELLLSLDGGAVESRCLALARSFREAAASSGFTLVPEEAPSQIVALRLPDAEAVKRRLAERRVIAAVRGGYLRLGFHAFNDEHDVEAALAALA